MRYAEGEHGAPNEAVQARLASLLRRNLGSDVRVLFEPLPKFLRFADYRIHGDWLETPSVVYDAIAACLLEASAA